MNSKSSMALHCLVFISEYESKVKITSDLLTKSTGCNSAGIRSILNALKKANIITIVRGVGGAHLNVTPEALTVWDIYHALEPTELEHFIEYHPNPSKQCPLADT